MTEPQTKKFNCQNELALTFARVLVLLKSVRLNRLLVPDRQHYR